MSKNKANQVSPLSTGGAGTIMEYQLAAVVLAKLLVGDSVVGVGGIAQVRLQGAPAGHSLDDIVAFQSMADTPRTEIQVKRTVSPVSSNKEFVSVVEQCLHGFDEYGDAVDAGEVLFCLAAAGPINQLNQLRDLAELARAHNTYSSLQAILVPKVTAKEVCERFEHVKKTVAKILKSQGKTPGDDELDILTHRLLKGLQVWLVDVGANGRDTEAAINSLARVIPQDVKAADVYTHLVAIAEELGPRAGTVDVTNLRALLARRDVTLSADPQKQKDLVILQASSHKYLEGLPRTMGTSGSSLHLPRTAAINKVMEMATARELTLLSGSPGVGKTVLMGDAMLELAKDKANTVIGLSVANRTGQSIADIQAELGADLAATLPGVATTGVRVFFIDGTEQALTDGGQLIKRLLTTVPKDPVGGWHIVMTARSDAAQIIAQLLSPNVQLVPYPINELDDDEVAAVVKKFPTLASLQRHPRSARLLRRPYIIDLIVRLNITDGTKSLGEEDVLASFWHQIIRRAEGANPGRGSADVREQICLDLAEEMMTSIGPIKLRATDGEALAGLRSDDVLTKNHTYHEFAHDIMLDYVCAYKLTEQDADTLLAKMVSLRRFIRAVRLAMQWRLANAINPQSIVETWHVLQEQAHALATKDGERWHDVPYLALINLGNPGPVLRELKADLLADDGKQLSKLLNVARHNAVTAQMEEADRDHEIDTTLVTPIVELLADIGADLPFGSSFLAPELTRRWLLAVYRNGNKPGDFLDDPAKLATSAVTWHREDYGDQLDAVLSVLGLLANYWPGKSADEILNNLIATRPHELSVLVEDPDNARSLARLNPALCLKIAKAYYVGWLPSEDTWTDGMLVPDMPSEEEEEGVRDHDPKYFYRRKEVLASPDHGPFAALLEASPEHGLKLVSTIVRSATKARIQLESRYDDKPGDSIIEISLGDGEKVKTYRGTGHTWVWYRRGGVGPYSAISSLLALHRWATDQTKHRPVNEVADEILSMGDSNAFVAVALSLFITNFSSLTRELDPYLEHPVVWHLERSRLQQEQGGLVYPIDKDSALNVEFDRVVMYYLLNNKKRKSELKAIGEKLVANARAELADVLGEPPESDHQELLVARKWAGLLDYDLYQFSPPDEDGNRMLEIKYPKDLVEALGKNAATPELNIRASNLLFTAKTIRDGEKTGDAVALWRETTSTLQEFERLGVKDILHEPSEVIACVAASVIVNASKGEDCPDEILKEATSALVEVAMATPAVFDIENGHDKRSMVWPQGADRSAATALPLLLLSPQLLKRSGLTYKKVEEGILKLAKGVASDTRQRLAYNLSPALDHPCSEVDHTLHDTVFKVLNELVRSSGMSEERVNYHYQPRYLTGALDSQLATDKHVLYIGMVSDAMPWLVRAARLDCSHGKEATDMLEILMGHDVLAWPAHYAGHHYVDTNGWRDNLNAYIAERVLSGDTALLTRYLEAFAETPEELSGILYQLAEQAKTKEQGQRLFELWPDILDQLLPTARTVTKNGKRRVSSRDTEELDKALLPMPTKNASWPPDLLLDALGRWGRAFKDRPQYLERLLKSLAVFGLALHPSIVPFVLTVAGDNYERIERHASVLVVAWAQLIFDKDDLPPENRAKLVNLIDNLARLGNTEALELQRNLES